MEMSGLSAHGSAGMQEPPPNYDDVLETMAAKGQHPTSQNPLSQNQSGNTLQNVSFQSPGFTSLNASAPGGPAFSNVTPHDDVPANRYIHYQNTAISSPTTNFQNSLQNPSLPFQAAGFQSSTAARSWLMGHPNAGLGLMDRLDTVNVERIVDMMDATLGLSPMLMKRQFLVMNTQGQQVFILQEDESCLSQQYQRAFTLTARDSHGQELFVVSRGNEHCACAFCCACIDPCQSKAMITTPKLGCIGNIQQRVSCTSARFVLLDKDSNAIMDIYGSNACCGPNVSYRLALRYGDRHGQIHKEGANWGQGVNKYTLRFPSNATPQVKACCIGALILFDFRFHLIPSRSR